MAQLLSFRVVGRGDFPTDMLRYDACWPCDSGDARKICESLYGMSDKVIHEWIKNYRCITLYTFGQRYSVPTEGRWSSFGWSVVNESLFGGRTNAQVEEAMGSGYRAQLTSQDVPSLLDAVEALGVMPEGYCFCSKDRVGDNRKVHEPECRDLRAAIARLKGVP